MPSSPVCPEGWAPSLPALRAHSTGSEEASGRACASRNRTLREVPGKESRTQILPRVHVHNEAVRGPEKGVAQQGCVGYSGPIAPGLGGGTSRSDRGQVV